MRKNVWVTLITFITLSFGYPLSSYSDIITKDGVKIQFFKKGQKKSIPKLELLDKKGISSMEDEYLDKIVFSSSKDIYTSYSIKVYDFQNRLLLRKDDIWITDKKKGFILPIYPWIQWGGLGDYQNDEEYNLIGRYRIVIDSKNEDKVLNEVDIIYSVYEHIGD